MGLDAFAAFAAFAPPVQLQPVIWAAFYLASNKKTRMEAKWPCHFIAADDVPRQFHVLLILVPRQLILAEFGSMFHVQLFSADFG